MLTKKIVYLCLVASSLMFVGCGGGSSSLEDSSTPPIIDDTPPSDNTPPIIDDTPPIIDDTPPSDDTPPVDSNYTLDDFEDAVAHDPSFETTHFSGSQNCASCHDNLYEENNVSNDVSIVKAWKGTMMDHAAIDPLYLAKVASEIQRNPNFKEVIENKCSRCHMPMANVQAKFDGITPKMFGEDSFTDSNSEYYHAAKEGISCTLCHQIEDKNLGTELGFSGDFSIDQYTAKPDRKIYGPYTDPQQVGRMQNAVGFIPVGEVNATGVNHMTDSKLCASCHNLNTPVINADGNLSNPLVYFPEQAVYTEWEFSKFSNSNTKENCQDCHMPTTTGSVVIATGGSTTNPLQSRSPFYQHKFLGANSYMLDILKNNITKLGSLADTATFEKSITNTKEFLKAAADVNITAATFDTDTLEFSVKVTNHSGHKFPTSIPIRRAWLYVKVTNGSGETVFESGAMNSNGQIIGVDDTEGYEEHHEELDSASEVQVYEAIMLDTAGNQTYTFLNAASYAKDNRILPKGYRSDTPASAQPYGKSVEDSDFIGGSDTVKYEVNEIPEDEYSVSVTLKYQTVSYGFMQDLYKDINLTEVALMKVLDDNAQIHFEDISTDTATYTPN